MNAKQRLKDNTNVAAKQKALQFTLAGVKCELGQKCVKEITFK